MAAKIRGWSPVAASRIKKTIPVELVMTKDIARADVSLELLKARMEDAGYETMTENGEMFVFRTGFSLRIQNFFENASLRMRVHIFLNKEITDAMLHSFVAKLNADSYSVKFSAYRWDDGDVGLFGDCVLFVKVRLTEIDAPEKKQAFGNRSKESLSDLCFGKTATLFEKGKDRYGRTLARVTCDGTDANAEQVRRGLAWAYTKYLTDPQIKVLEEEARASRLGLWHDDKSVPPWEWRKAKRT